MDEAGCSSGRPSQRRRSSAGASYGCPRPSSSGNSDGDLNGEEEAAEGAERGDGGRGDGGDETTRRLLRQEYRALINIVQHNREKMLSTRNDKLTETLEEANRLFTGVSRAREAALDAQFLVLASNLGKEKASQLQSDMAVFDPSAFAEDLLSFMGLNRLEGDESDSDSDSDSEWVAGFLPSNAWHTLGEEAKKYFRRAPTFHFMLGAFNADPPVQRPRIEKQQKKAEPAEKRAMPAQLKKMEESHQEATEKEVERILGYLQSFHREDRWACKNQVGSGQAPHNRTFISRGKRKQSGYPSTEASSHINELSRMAEYREDF